MSAAKPRDLRLTALRRFAFAITLLNLLGHTVLGFEQSWAQPFVALATAYVLELLLEWITARGEGRAPRFAGSASALFHFLLPAHITALACSMLIYPGDRLLPLVFAVAVAICSKTIFRAPVGSRRRHFLNPSNAGITATLLLFPSVGMMQPYMFTESFVGWQNWALPAVIIVSGSFLNLRLTRKMPLILAWVGGFVAQALLRSLLTGAPVAACLLPVTGVAFLLFTFYMVSDPATTPFDRRRQVVFGLAVATVYGLLMAGHVVFTLFFSLSIVCVGRGAALAALHWADARRRARRPVELPAEVVGEPG
jgi:Na+-translocating ferredoxin:NAD+ oxidoreductase RnfD subunit